MMDSSLAAPLLSSQDIEESISKIKAQKRIPNHAVDILFDFYKNNRESTGDRLRNPSCVEKRDYRIRHQDRGLKIADLKKGIRNEKCLCVMDYTQSKDQKRGHCIFLEKSKDPTIESFFVAHGAGSQESKGVPTLFTNKLSSTGTTLSGLHLTAEKIYQFQGKAKAYGHYTSPGLGLYGVESVNWTAAAVGKVTHGAPYVSDDPKKFFIGRSHGCPAMTMEQAKSILPRCVGGAAWLNYTRASAAQVQTKSAQYCN